MRRQSAAALAVEPENGAVEVYPQPSSTTLRLAIAGGVNEDWEEYGGEVSVLLPRAEVEHLRDQLTDWPAAGVAMTTIDRTPKPCLHKRASHQHGDRNAYILDRCRCLPCAAANSAYGTRRLRLKAYGRPTPTGLVDAAPVRVHVEQLQAAGMGWRTIAARAGVSHGTLTRLLFGKPSQGQPPSKRVKSGFAQRVLAVPIPTVDHLAAAARVNGVGTRRRLQALVAAGWSQTALATHLGVSIQNFSGLIHGERRNHRGSEVLAVTARNVARLYDEVWDQQPPASGRSYALRVAARNGWAGPLAWDDDTIDDPAAEALTADVADDQVDEHALELVLDGQPMRLTGRDLEVAVDRLMDAGLGFADVAARVRSDEKTVRRIRNSSQVRAGRAARREAA